MKPHVCVVEGRHDADKIKRIFPDLEVITTQGSVIDTDTIELLQKLEETHEIILFLDPDYPGERIRHLLSGYLKSPAHVFIDRRYAKSNNRKKIGVEHASSEDIKKAFQAMRLVNRETDSDITYAYLYDKQLIGHPDSKVRRKQLSDDLHIGHVNGKTLYHRLRLFNIHQKDVDEVIK